jgi:hypothetical protein
MRLSHPTLKITVCVNRPLSRQEALTDGVGFAELLLDDDVRIRVLDQLQLDEVDLDFAVLHEHPVLDHLLKDITLSEGESHVKGLFTRTMKLCRFLLRDVQFEKNPIVVARHNFIVRVNKA